MTDYKPGDVGMLKCSDGQERIAILTDRGNLAPLWIASGPEWGRLNEIDVRPLVVLDLAAIDQTAGRIAHNLRLCAAARDTQSPHGRCVANSVRDLADQIEQQTKPPKPEEPTGLGAVVEDAEGRQWTRYDTMRDPQPWWCNGAGPRVPIERRFSYADIDAVKVSSPGVEA